MARLSNPLKTLPAWCFVLVLLAACGNRGPLYLPAEDAPAAGGGEAAPAPTVIEPDVPEDPAPFGPAGGPAPDDEEDGDDDVPDEDGRPARPGP